MLLQKNFKNIALRVVCFKSQSTLAFFIYFLFSVFIFDASKAETNFPNTRNNQIEIDYLDSRNELEDYIIDTGDSISLKFYPAQELNGIFPVSEEGELFLPRLNETFVRGLTTSELKKLLEKRYAEFLIEPDIEVRIAVFKSIRVLVKGELRNPGFYKFPSYRSVSFININKYQNSDLDLLIENDNESLEEGENSQFNNQPSENIIGENLITISDVIKKAGGITSLSDLSRIEIIRNVPLGKGGGKKRAIIDFYPYLSKSDTTSNIRIFDGDTLFFPKLIKKDPNQIPKSVLSGISPKFISVNLFGRVENPGVIKVPLEAALSDAIDISGPIKPLSGKIVLIRYEKDGTLTKKNISYSARAKRGSKRNPFLKEDDLISVKNSFVGKITGVTREVTAPFVGIYSIREIIK